MINNSLFNIKALTYDLLIDPLLSGLKRTMVEKIPAGASVIDIACGTGSLAAAIAQEAENVTGIDLDSNLIRFAKLRAEKRNISNIQFLVKDASILSDYQTDQFDISVTSMSIHQFDENLAINIMKEMKRISGKVIIADYNCPMPAGLSRTLAYSIEKIAGGDHYRNFINYMRRGGLDWFAASADLTILAAGFKGYGIFKIAEYK